MPKEGTENYCRRRTQRGNNKRHKGTVRGRCKIQMSLTRSCRTDGADVGFQCTNEDLFTGFTKDRHTSQSDFTAHILDKKKKNNNNK